MDGKSAAPDLTRAVGTAELYRLTAAQAQEVVDHVRRVLSNWREVADQHGLGRPEVQRMESVIQA